MNRYKILDLKYKSIIYICKQISDGISEKKENKCNKSNKDILSKYIELQKESLLKNKDMYKELEKQKDLEIERRTEIELKEYNNLKKEIKIMVETIKNKRNILEDELKLFS